MDDLINRQADIDFICETSCGYEKMDCIGSRCKIVEAIEKMPAVKAMAQMSLEDCISRQAANDFNRVVFLMAHMMEEE